MIKTSYNYDQDPRYGWVSIDMDKSTSVDIIVQDKGGVSYGYTFRDGNIAPTCICSARSRGECGCHNLPWDYWGLS